MSDLSLAAQSSIERYDISQYQIYRFNGGEKPNVQTVTVDDVMAYQSAYGDYDYALVYTMDYRPGIIILYSSNEVVWDY